MRLYRLAALLTTLAVSACAMTPTPHVRGGPPFAWTSAEAEQVHVDAIHVEGTRSVLDRFQSYRGEDPVFDERQDPLHSQRAPFIENDFSQTFEWELRDELGQCATGAHPVTAVVLIDEFRMDERLRSLVDARGFDAVSGVVEFVDPVSDTVIARYRIRAGTNSGGLLSRIVGDRASNAAEEFARALCMEAFGRNPRPPAIQNSTRG